MSETSSGSGFRAVRKGLEIYIERENPPICVKVISGEGEEDTEAYLMHAEWAAARLAPDADEDRVKDVCDYIQYYPVKLLLTLGPAFDYDNYAHDRFLEDPDELGGDPWCMTCGEPAEGIMPGGERDTIADGSPICFVCVERMDRDREDDIALDFDSSSHAPPASCAQPDMLDDEGLDIEYHISRLQAHVRRLQDKAAEVESLRRRFCDVIPALTSGSWEEIWGRVRDSFLYDDLPQGCDCCGGADKFACRCYD